MTFCDMLVHMSVRRCFKSLVTAAGIAYMCLYNVYTRSCTSPQIFSQPDCLADIDLERLSPVFPAKGAGLFHEHRGTSERISVAAI